MQSRFLASLSLPLLLIACGPKPATTPPAAQPAAEPTAEAPKAAPIPAGWFAITPQLVVPDVDAAIAFYGAALGAEKVFAMPGPDGKTMHGEIKIGDSLVMLDIENGEMKSPKTLGGTPGELMVYVPDVDAAFQKAVDAGATVEMPVADQFWGDRYGVVVDPAGHRWGLATHKEDLTDEQMMQRAELMMAEMAAAAKKPKAKKAKKPKDPEWKKVAGTPAAAPVPAQYHTVTLGITANDVASAIEFYKATFGGTETSRMAMPDGKVMHAEVKIGDSVIMLSDASPAMGNKSPKDLGGTPMMIHHYTTDVDGVFAKAVAAGGTATMPVADMFWGDRYGAIVGPDGFGWGIATHIEDLTPEQMAERMKAQMGGQPAEGTPPASDPAAAPPATPPAAPAASK
jgi:PhnB protein